MEAAAYKRVAFFQTPMASYPIRRLLAVRMHSCPT